MAGTIADLTKAARTAAQNTLKARQAGQAAAAEIAALRPAQPPLATIPAEAPNGTASGAR